MLFEKKKTITLHVSGMHCAHCVAKVEKALKALGCKAEVSLEEGKATVTCPESLSAETIEEAVAKAGFPAKVAP